jgi:hypothetical protein
VLVLLLWRLGNAEYSVFEWWFLLEAKLSDDLHALRRRKGTDAVARLSIPL